MTDYSILFQYASRSRPENFFRGLKSITDNVASDNYLVNVVIDFDDTSMNDPYTINRIRDIKNTQVSIGRSKNKICAINRMPQPKYDIIVNMSDDMLFTTKGFDNIIRQGFTDYYPNLDGVLFFNDGVQKANCMTMSIIGGTYFERDKYIYCPEYESLECDLEAMDVARMRGKIQYMGDHLQIFKHLHPSFGLAPMDAQYEKTEAMDVRNKDQDTYNRRKANNFYL